MSIEDKLVDSSRKLIDYIVAEVKDDAKLFKETLDIAYEGKPQIASRASRVVCFCAEMNPDLMYPHIDTFVENTINQRNNSVVMNFLKTLTFNILPTNDESLGKLVNFCFERLMDKEEKPAITVYAMEILYLISRNEPDISNELKAVIETRIVFGSPGIKYRGKEILKKLMR
jgi:hypothetical protein